MALDLGECREMLSLIVKAIDYDIWKEMVDEDTEDGINIDYLVSIVEQYVKINP